jgi:hypothetical protein
MSVPLRDKRWLPTPQRYFVATALITVQEVEYDFIWDVFNTQDDSEFSLTRFQLIK